LPVTHQRKTHGVRLYSVAFRFHVCQYFIAELPAAAFLWTILMTT